MIVFTFATSEFSFIRSWLAFTNIIPQSKYSIALTWGTLKFCYTSLTWWTTWLTFKLIIIVEAILTHTFLTNKYFIFTAFKALIWFGFETFQTVLATLLTYRVISIIKVSLGTSTCVIGIIPCNWTWLAITIIGTLFAFIRTL